MSQISAERLGALIGGVDKIIDLLHFGALPEDTQILLIERFSDIFFKRLLLRVPKERSEEMKQALDTADDMDVFMTTLERLIPNFDASVEAEMKRTLADFKH